MLAAINTDTLNYFPIDEWLSSSKHNDEYSALRDSQFLKYNIFDNYYRTCATNKRKLFETIDNDLRIMSCHYYETNDLLGMSFPFFIVDTKTKETIEKIEVEFQIETVVTKVTN